MLTLAILIVEHQNSDFVQSVHVQEKLNILNNRYFKYLEQNTKFLLEIQKSILVKYACSWLTVS